MSITKEQNISNVKKYFATGEKYKFMTEKLVETLGAKFIEAPASTRTDLYNAFEGGLIKHLLNVTKYAVAIKEIAPDGDKIAVESLIKVCCLHQIGKYNLFTPKNSKWHNDNGIMYDFNDEIVSMHVGERSAHLAMSNGVELTTDEYQAIINHDKSCDDKQATFHTNLLGIILKQANEFAIFNTKKNG